MTGHRRWDARAEPVRGSALASLRRRATSSSRRTAIGLRSFIERGRRGYASADLEDFDPYLARLIQQAVLEIAERDPGMPADLDAEEWQRVLAAIAAGFGVKAARGRQQLPPDDERTWREGAALFIRWFDALST